MCRTPRFASLFTSFPAPYVAKQTDAQEAVAAASTSTATTTSTTTTTLDENGDMDSLYDIDQRLLVDPICEELSIEDRRGQNGEHRVNLTFALR